MYRRGIAVDREKVGSRLEAGIKIGLCTVSKRKRDVVEEEEERSRWRCDGAVPGESVAVFVGGHSKGQHSNRWGGGLRSLGRGTRIRSRRPGGEAEVDDKIVAWMADSAATG